MSFSISGAVDVVRWHARLDLVLSSKTSRGRISLAAIYDIYMAIGKLQVFL